MLNNFFDDMNISPDSGPNLDNLVSVQKQRVETIKEIAEKSIFFYKDFENYDMNLAEKYFQPSILAIFKELYSELKDIDAWGNKNISNIISKLTKKFDIKIGKLAQPLRIAITGTNISPSIDDTLHLLGQEKSLVRLKRAIKYIENHDQS